MARKPRLWKSGSFKPLYVGGKRDKARRYIVTHGKDTGEIISLAERSKRVLGLHPEKLAKERKAGRLGYGPKLEERVIPKSVITRRRFSRDHWSNPNDVYGRHPFLSKDGFEYVRPFNGRPLAFMQTYRTDWYGRLDDYGVKVRLGAIDTGDGSALKKYDRLKIYDADGNRVHPETDVKKLQRWWNGKSARQRENFEKELFYLTAAHLTRAAA
jgi:hypothetical protein